LIDDFVFGPLFQSQLDLRRAAAAEAMAVRAIRVQV
jgi:hypothetical protein